MLDGKKILMAEDVKSLFGNDSSIYQKSIEFLQSEAIINKNFRRQFESWKKIFKGVYGEDLNENLFLKHLYFAAILKIISIIKLTFIKNLNLEDSYNIYVKNEIDLSQIPEFHYFNWLYLDITIFKKIFDILEGSHFAHQDLFIELYQELIFSLTRHKIGEFYTPVNLVQKMVNYVYRFGDKVLDPSCGSGNFLIEIILKIINSDKPGTQKVEAINNIYGFDINPLATLTSKVNIQLLLLDYSYYREKILPNLNIFLINSLFPQEYENFLNIDIKELYDSFDLIIGNPPWLTYKDLTERDYQDKIRKLTEKLEIKPLSQYITHIDLSAVFFYAIASKFLKIEGTIFFVITKSVLNGDHCEKFRAFPIFDNLEIWDFPNSYFFNIKHICLKANYIGKNNNSTITSKYPIKTKIFDSDLEIQEELHYSSLKLEHNKAKLILPERELNALKTISESPYKDKFFQGATLVPRSLIFFRINEKENRVLLISSDQDILSRTKKRWTYSFESKKIEQDFHFKTFLNKDLIPFRIKLLRDVFLPITREKLVFDLDYLKKYPNAYRFYTEINSFYEINKKKTSNISTLYENLNYWDKLAKQCKNEEYLVIYNASGSYLKASVINVEQQKIIIGSENYYYSTNSKSEAYYLSAILNSPILSQNIKLIKSSRHIHKRPFSFPIPFFDRGNELHLQLSRKAIKCESIVQDLYLKNPDINSSKVRIIVNHKMETLNSLVEKVVFKEKK